MTSLFDLNKGGTRKIRLASKYGLAGLVGGVPDLALTAANLTKQGSNYLVRGEFGDPILPYGYFSGKVVDGINQLPGENIMPETASERIIAAGSEVLGSGLPGIARGVAKNAPKLSKYLLAQNPKEAAQFFATGAGAQSANELFPESAIAPIVGGLAGSSVVRGPGYIGNKVKKLADVDPQAVKALDDSGLPLTLGLTTNSKGVAKIEQGLKQLPVVGKPLEKAQKKFLNVTDNLAGGVGKEISGEELQNSLRRYDARAKNVASKLYDRSNAYMTNAEIAPTNFLQVKNEMFGNFVTNEALQDFKKKPVGKSLQELDEILSSKQSKGVFPFHDLKQKRRDIDDLISSAKTSGNREVARDLTIVRNSIQDDIKGYLQSTDNQQGLKDFERANKFYTKYSELKNNTLDSILQKTAKETRSPIASFNKVLNLMKTDPKKIEFVYNKFNPSERKMFNESVITELGNGGASGFSPVRLASNFNKLPENSKKLILKQYNTDTANDFRNVMKAMEKVKSLQSVANNSKTSIYNTLYKGGATLAAGSILGLKNAILLAASGTGGSLLFSSPKFVRWAASVNKSNDKKGIVRQLDKLATLAKAEPHLEPALENIERVIEEQKEYSESLELYQRYYGNKKSETVAQSVDEVNNLSQMSEEEAIKLYNTYYKNKS